MFAHQISERGLAERVRVTSAGTGGWHAGDAADRRASHVLRAHGYPTAHRAAQIDDDHLAADLVVALGRNHVRMLPRDGRASGPAPDAAVVRPALGRACAWTSRTPTTATTDDFEAVFTVIERRCPACTSGSTSSSPSRGIAS